MRVLVCGGRDWCDILTMMTVMDGLSDVYGPFTHLIHGGAPGADDEAGCWALQRDLPTTVYRAEWEKHGRAAGPIRNKLMLGEGRPDMVVAFPGGRGTANMVKQAEAAGVRVIRVSVPATPQGEH